MKDYSINFIEHLLDSNSMKLSISSELESYLKAADTSFVDDYDLFFNRIVSKTKSRLQKTIEKSFIDKVYPKYVFSDYDDDYLIRYNKTLSDDFLDERVDKVLQISHNLKSIIKKSSWQDFEVLCKILIIINGVENANVTKATRDDGIDFYGYLDFKEFEHLNRLASNIRLRIIGQARHTTKNSGVSHEKISSFGTEINRIRSRNNAGLYGRNMNAGFLESSYPILGLFITNCFVPPKAKNFADEYGIIIWNEEQISHDIANSDLISRYVDVNNILDYNRIINDYR